MNKRDLEMDYVAFSRLKKAYAKAETANDKAGMQQIESGFSDLLLSIRARGEDYGRISRLYNDAKNRGNDYIDVSEPYSIDEAKALIDLLRAYGFDRVTFSSGWSSAVALAWEFTKNGCTVEGMVLINGPVGEFTNEEGEKIPAYLFKLN